MTQEKTTLELLVELGNELRALSRNIAMACGFMERNPAYKRLPRDTPLYINCQPYVVKRSREEGERDLVALANDVPYEGSWLYTPQDSNWYHVSKGHEEEFGERGKFTLSAILPDIDLRIAGEQLFDYHTHPKKAVEHLLDYWTQALLPRYEGDELGKRVTQAILPLCAHFYACFPSPKDVAHYAFIKREVGDTITFEARIASPIGITRIEIEDPSESTVSLYEKLHDGLYKRMGDDKIIQVERSDDKGVNIGVYGENVFDSVNKEMKGKMKFTFVPGDAYYKMLRLHQNERTN